MTRWAHAGLLALAASLALGACSGGGGSGAPADGTTGDGTEDGASDVPALDVPASDTSDVVPADSDAATLPEVTAEVVDEVASSDCQYAGAWPCNPDKDDIADPGWQGECPGSTGCVCGPDDPWLGWIDSDECDSGACYGQPKEGFCAPGPGTPVPRFVGVDQFGQEVDLYDFAGQGKIIALDMSAGWCTPCKELVQWFIDGDPLVKANPWWNESWVPIREMVQTGQILWITILYEDENGEDATPALASWWHQSWPHEDIAILVDDERQLHTWLRPTGLPCVNLIADDMTTLTYTDRGVDAAFDKLMELYTFGGL